ncbi:hypothetical protein EJB05_51248, partial [Eragrostis curvula]
MAESPLVPRVKLGTQGLEVRLLSSFPYLPCRRLASSSLPLFTGGTGLPVSNLGFGCMGLSGAYNSPVDDEAGIAVIAHAFRRGVTFFDTSDVYGPLTNEILLGKVPQLSS